MTSPTKPAASGMPEEPDGLREYLACMKHPIRDGKIFGAVCAEYIDALRAEVGRLIESIRFWKKQVDEANQTLADAIEGTGADQEPSGMPEQPDYIRTCPRGTCRVGQGQECNCLAVEVKDYDALVSWASAEVGRLTSQLEQMTKDFAAAADAGSKLLEKAREERDAAERRAEAAERGQDGTVTVPREPTTTMMIAGSRAGAQTPIGAELIYKAMLSAAALDAALQQEQKTTKGNKV